MEKNKKWYIVTGAGLGLIFGYALWSAAAGLVLGAAAGLLIFTLGKKQQK